MKRCSKCGEFKIIISFSKDKNRKDYLSCWCKKCCKEHKIIYRQKHRKELNEKQKEYQRNYKMERYEYGKRWREENCERKSIMDKEYRNKNREKLNKQQKEKRHNIPQKRIRHSISSLMRLRLKKRLIGKNKKSTFDFLPYKIHQLMQRLECQFKPGMTWNNYGKWHIDHKKPESLFNYSNILDNSFQDCWALANLQPLWAIDNIKKSNKFYENNNN